MVGMRGCETFTSRQVRGILSAYMLDMQGCSSFLPQLGRHVAWSCRPRPQMVESLVRIEIYRRADIRLSMPGIDINGKDGSRGGYMISPIGVE